MVDGAVTQLRLDVGRDWIPLLLRGDTVTCFSRLFLQSTDKTSFCMIMYCWFVYLHMKFICPKLCCSTQSGFMWRLIQQLLAEGYLKLWIVWSLWTLSALLEIWCLDSGWHLMSRIEFWYFLSPESCGRNSAWTWKFTIFLAVHPSQRFMLWLPKLLE